MSDLDALAPNYQRACLRWPDALTLSQRHEALITCFDGAAYGMIEHVKSFVESVCLTILTEFNKPTVAFTSTTELLIAALQPLGLQNTRGASKLDKVLSGFNRLADALTEMRNDNGAAAHGKDAFLDAVTSDHARAFLHTGDAILSILLNALEGKQPDLIVTRQPYGSFPHLDARIDRAVNVKAWVDEEGDWPVVVVSVVTGTKEEAIEIRAEPSQFLYGIDRSAYIEVLRTVATVVPEPEVGDLFTAQVDVGRPDLATTPVSPPLAGVGPSYSGRLAVLRPTLVEFLSAEKVLPAEAPVDSLDLPDALLATADKNMGLDWRQRDTLQARLRVVCKRVLIQFGLDAKKAREISERLVVWMRVHVPEGDEADQETA